ncbi:MAG TPA: septal ring lytic transglycosylase RlpA family protein [Chroococcales cyanobacterium]
MTQRIWSGLTVTLMTTALGTVTSVQIQQAQAVDQRPEVSHPVAQVDNATATIAPASPQPSAQPMEVVKVGEFKSQAETPAQEEVVAKIHAYEVDGKQAATLYVRNIPVLTFLGSGTSATQGTKLGEAPARNKIASYHSDSANVGSKLNAAPQGGRAIAGSQAAATENDPVWRATAVAAKLNQLSRDNVNGNAIAVRWNPDEKVYAIEVKGEKLVPIDDRTILPDTTRNPAEDALQATNRLRRLMGNAPPLKEVAGQPQERKIAQLSLGPIRLQMTGVASWYGPGFHGRRSANGEVYNQNSMTAAHRSLPFGTNVQVTNLNNGRSVIVRITDRGPFVRGRVIDLSAAAARVLGVMQSGVAPVQLNVLDDSQTVVSDN